MLNKYLIYGLIIYFLFIVSLLCILTISSNILHYQTAFTYNINSTNSTKSYNHTPENGFIWTLSSNKNIFSVNETILVKGIIKSLYGPTVKYPVTIEVKQNNLTIYKISTMTNNEGKFNSSFRIPVDGLMTISANVPDEKPEIGALITVLVKMDNQTSTLIGVSIIVMMIIIVLMILKIKTKVKHK
jgi:hypothetical protein